MALCMYCGKVEVAWASAGKGTGPGGKRWVACIARRDGSGAVLKAPQVWEDRGGKKRTVMRPVPDEMQLHYPHEHWRDGRRGLLLSECAEWSPQAAASKGKKAWAEEAAAAAAVSVMGTPIEPQSTSTLLEALKRSVAEAAAMRAAMQGVSSMEAKGGTRLARQDATMVRLPPGTIVPSGPGPSLITTGMTMAVDMDADAPTVASVEREPEEAGLPEPERLLPKGAAEAWARADKAIRCQLMPMRVMLWGPPGTGKTELPWRIAQELGWAHVQQQMTEETAAVELLGRPGIKAGGEVWRQGSLGRAIVASWAGPTVYVVDEVGRASADAMSACLLALTNPESLRLTVDEGEVIAPRVENWHVVATSNDEPKLLPPALQDRLHVAVQLVSPNPALIRTMTTVGARRLACSVSREYSVRALLTWDRLVAAGMPKDEAARLVWEPQVAQAFMDATRLERGR